MHILVLAGGKGTRLWPLTNENTPKYLLKFDPSAKSFLGEALIRAALFSPLSVNINTSNALYKDVNDECSKILQSSDVNYILESEGKNTALSVAISTLQICQKYGPDSIISVFPSDHIIDDIEEFKKSIAEACHIAKEEQKIVLIGSVPSRADTNYGYIEHNKGQVLRFIEKPNHEVAQLLSSSENFLWNSGILCFQASILLSEMSYYCYNILEAAKIAIQNATNISENVARVDLQCFSDLPNISIDNALLETCKSLHVVHSNMQWDDVGNWEQFLKCNYPSSEGSNIVRANAILRETTNCYIYSSKPIVATIGLDNLIIVETADALFIADKSQSHMLSNIYPSISKMT